MKYWLFDGDDVVGPFAPHELAAREDFSATSLICAEGASEDSAGWQMASFFDAFRFNSVTGRLENTFLPEEPPTLTERALTQQAATDEKPAPAAPDKPVIQPAKVPEKPVTQPSQPNATVIPPVVKAARPKKQEPAFVRLTKVKKPATPPTPVALAQENADLDLVLPAKPVHDKTQSAPAAAEKPAASQPKKQADASSAKAEPAQEEIKKTTPAQKTTDTPEKEVTKTAGTSKATSKTVTPDEEILPTCTLPLLDEEMAARAGLPSLRSLEESNLPPVPEESQVPETPQDPAEFQESEKLPVAEEIAELVPASAPLEEAPAQPDTPAEKETSAATVARPAAWGDVSSLLKTEAGNQTPQTLEASLEEKYPLPKRPRVKTLSEIKRQFANRPEQEDFILEQQLLARSPRKKSRSVWVVPLFVIVVILIAGISGVRALSKRTSAPAKPLAQEAVQAEMLDTPKPAAAPAVAPAAKTNKPATAAKPAAPKPVTASEKALSAVQNYKLPGNKGTIAAYFDRVYQPNLAQGYTASWSVEPLHKNTYIVKYRLTKTRMEPIVYVFQADAVRGQLTGALNNVALDLVGRI